MTLYRYITLDRFFSSFKYENGIWWFNIRFNSPKFFIDPWEGLGNGLVKQLKTIEEESIYVRKAIEAGGKIDSKKGVRKTFYKLQGNNGNLLDSEITQALQFSNKHLTSCWFQSSNLTKSAESFAMWDLYAPKNGVLISFKLDSILKVLDAADVYYKADHVYYIEFLKKSFDKDLHLSLDSLFLKDSSYGHENEFRIILKNVNNESFKDILAPLPTEIIANPQMSKASILHLNLSLKRYGIHVNPSQLASSISRMEIIDYLLSEG